MPLFDLPSSIQRLWMYSAKSLDGFTLWHGPFHSIHKSGKTGKEKGKSCSMKFQILSVDYNCPSCQRLSE